MADLNFPQNPNPGDSYSIGSRTWTWNGTAWVLQSSVQKLDPFTVGTLIVTTTTNSTSTTTGAAIIYGGLGVGQDLWAQKIFGTEIYENGLRVLTQIRIDAGTGIQITTGSAGVFTITNIGVTSLTGTPYLGVSSNTGSVTLTNLGVQTLTAGTDTAVSSNTGTITVWNTSTLQSITNRGNTTDNVIHITNTSSGNTGTGALIVDGGAYVGGDLFVSGVLYSGGAPLLTTSSFAQSFNTGTDIAITVNPGTGAVTISNTSTLQSVTGRGSTTTNRVTFANTVNATSTLTGAILVSGGIGVGKDIYAAGNVTSNNVTANSIIIGNSLYSYFTSPVITSGAAVNLDAFNVNDYRTAKYLVQVVDTGFIPNLIHSAELLVTHDHGGFGTTGYIVQYGIVTNMGELGSWDSVYAGGLLQLQFTPNYVPTSMVIKVNRTVMTT